MFKRIKAEKQSGGCCCSQKQSAATSRGPGKKAAGTEPAKDEKTKAGSCGGAKAVALGALMALLLPLSAQADGFKMAATFVKQPGLMPQLGTLYVDPGTLPVGPYLGFDDDGKLMTITYMLPLDQLNAHREFRALGHEYAGMKIDHIDITYSAGHKGADAPHYLVSEWLINRDKWIARSEQKK